MGYDYATPQEVASLHSQINSLRQDIIQQHAEIDRLQTENQQLRERQETLEVRNLPEWKPTITPESLK